MKQEVRNLFYFLFFVFIALVSGLPFIGPIVAFLCAVVVFIIIGVVIFTVVYLIIIFVRLLRLI